ncbi:hypothetical protein C8J56DRAFT_1027872 [Mycena floridula]|nr:hypothetical protein C8J56DRAFT_1027872 [Mycena floridula]
MEHEGSKEYISAEAKKPFSIPVRDENGREVKDKEGRVRYVRNVESKVLRMDDGEIYHVLCPPPELTIPAERPQNPYYLLVDNFLRDNRQRPCIHEPELFTNSKTVHWEKDGVMPYRGFIPVNIRFRDSLLRCLSYETEGMIPLVAVAGQKGCYIIPKTIFNSWKRLENVLLVLRYTFKLPAYPLEYVSASSPTAHLRGGGKNIEEMRAKAWRVIQGFLLLLAEVSHHIAAYHRCDRFELEQPWQQKLNELKLLARDRDQLTQSAIFDFSIERRGLFVDLRASKMIYAWDITIKSYLNAEVPLFLDWGKQYEPLFHTTPQMFMHQFNLSHSAVNNAMTLIPEITLMDVDPVQGEVQALEAVEEHEIHVPYVPQAAFSLWSNQDNGMGSSDNSSTMHVDVANPIYEPCAPNRPRPYQRREESWQDFFKRRQEKEKEEEKKESDSSRQARLQRQVHAQRGMAPAPSSTSPHTFEWVMGDKGYLLRQYVPRSDVEELWRVYKSHQKRYSSFSNEWDLCEEFPAHDVAAESHYYDNDDDDDEDDYMMPSHLRRPASVVPLGEDQVGKEKILDDELEEGEIPDVSRNVEEAQLNPVVADEVLTSSEPLELDAWIPPLEFNRFDAMGWEQGMHYRYGVRFVEGDSSHPDLSVEEEARWKDICASLCWDLPDQDPNQARQLIAAFQGKAKDGIAAGHSDLDAGNLDFLDRTKNRAFQVVVHQSKGTFVITDRSTDVKLEVKDSRSVMHVLRAQHLQNVPDVISEFLHNGIAFRPLVPNDGGKIKRLAPALGYRDAGWEPDHRTDFELYCHQRDEFLRDPVVAHAALHAGGLVWRLAIHANEFTLLRSEEYLKDYSASTLGEEDLNLICGVYRVRTSATAANWSSSSWFPKPPAWGRGAFEVGFWSQKAESWYMAQLDNICEGRIGGIHGFRTQTLWGQAVRLQSRRRSLAKAIQKATDDALLNGKITT